MSKKPDLVVFDEEDQKYNAGLLPYATNASAPKITSTDLTGWKNTNISKANHQINTEYEKLKNAYDKLIEQYEYNSLVYNAQFNFEPIVGQTYHLYIKENQESHTQNPVSIPESAAITVTHRSQGSHDTDN